MRCALIAAVLLVTAHISPALAQELITPEEPTGDDAMLTTHETPAQPSMPSGVSPFQRVQTMPAPPAPLEKSSSSAPAAGVSAPAQYRPKVPFGRGEAATMAPVPSGPRSTAAVPVVTVDELEAAEPAPPTPIEPEADPAAENPEEPTELTSPIFEQDATPLAPRRVIVRALNKVTAQSAKLALKPGQKIAFGQLEIIAIACQQSSPKSQADHAALLEIVEKMPADASLKSLFRGWMYASSPSIAALEHPIYDVTLIECEMMPAAKKAEESKDSEVKAGKKPKR